MRQIINSRFEFVQYCLRKLGAPVIRINITEQQIDDRINDALDMFLQFHMDGSYRGVHVHQITQEDIDAEKIILPENIMSVISVYRTTDPSMNSMSAGNNLQMQAYFSDLISRTYNQGDIASYTITQSYFGTLQNSMPNGVTRVTSYRIYENSLIVPDINWKKIAVGTLIGIDCYQFTDPDTVGKVFNDYWLKQYATALIKLQWANNISKFTNIALPGGGTLNGDQLMQQAMQEISDLEIKLQNQFSLPILPFMN